MGLYRQAGSWYIDYYVGPCVGDRLTHFPEEKSPESGIVIDGCGFWLQRVL